MSDDKISGIIKAFLRDLQRVLAAAKRRKAKADDLKALEDTIKRLEHEIADVLKQMSSGQGWRWEETPYSDVEAIKREHRKLTPYIIRASVRQLGDVTFLDGQDVATAVLQDTVSHDTISTGSISEPLLSRLQELRRRNAVLDYLGCSTQLPFLGIYVFIIVDIRPLESPFQLAMASPGEVETARDAVSGLLQAGVNPIDWLRAQVVELVGIRNLESGTLLDEMLEAMILQALSDNYVENAMGRVHTLIVGPPASGKKLLVDAAQTLNLAFEHAGHKMTAAGLVGNAGQQKGGAFVTEPGMLPLAHRGTLALEDFHQLTRQRLNEILGHISQVMEDGEVYDSTAAKTKLVANTSVHLDLNRASDLYPGKKSPKADFEDLPFNIISRFDVIYDYGNEPARMFDTAAEMARNIRAVGPDMRADRKERTRKVQLVIAMLRDEIPVVEIPEAINEDVANYILEVGKRYEPFPRIHEWLGKAIARMVHSLYKLAAANARGHMRHVALQRDVERAKVFVNQKIEFICRLVWTEADTWGGGDQHERFETALSRFGDSVFGPGEYGKATDVAQATAYRDLGHFVEQGLARQPGKKEFVLLAPKLALPPPPDEKEKLDQDFEMARGEGADAAAKPSKAGARKSLADRLKRFVATDLTKEEQKQVLAALRRARLRRQQSAQGGRTEPTPGDEGKAGGR